MTNYTKPLADKKLEAAAQILVAWVHNLAHNREFVTKNPKSPLKVLQTAIRETLAGELAACLENYPVRSAYPNRDVFEASVFDWLEERHALLARFKELSE